jgi:hypothetical protein
LAGIRLLRFLGLAAVFSAIHWILLIVTTLVAVNTAGSYLGRAFYIPAVLLMEPDVSFQLLLGRIHPSGRIPEWLDAVFLFLNSMFWGSGASMIICARTGRKKRA